MRLDIRIDPDVEKAVWKQIYDQIRDAALVRKTLKPLTKIPPERLLAAQLGITRMAVTTAYRTLASEGILETKHSSWRVAENLHPDHIHTKEFNPQLPLAFRKHPLPNRWLNADEIVQAVAILWDSWPNCSWAYEELKYVLMHFEGDFDGDPKSLSHPRI